MKKERKPQTKQPLNVSALSLKEKLKQLAKEAEKNHRDRDTFDFEKYEKSLDFEKYLLHKANPKCLTRGNIIELASRRRCSSNSCLSAAKHLESCKACRSEFLDWAIFYIKTA